MSEADPAISAALRIDRPLDGALVVTLNRPQKHNALSPALVDVLGQALDVAETQDARLFVLRGEGPSFCAGFDLSDLDALSDGDLLLRFVRIEMLLHRLATARFATMAIAHGRVTGAGADLLVACDRRFVAADAKVSFPGAGFGLILGTQRLAARVGMAAAREIVRSGRTLDADEAVRLGLASQRLDETPPEALIARELSTAARLDSETVAALHGVGGSDGATELAALVRSAARPGLKDRILAYWARAGVGRVRASQA